MNPYVSVETYLKDLLKYVDLMFAAYYESTAHHGGDYVLGWQLKQRTEQASQYEKQANQLLNEMDNRLLDTASTSVLIPLEHIVETFKLNYFERFCLRVCIAIELDPSFEKNIRFFNESLNSPYPTLGLLLKIYSADLNQYLEERVKISYHHKLIKYFFIESVGNRGGQPLIGIPLELDANIVEYILNFDDYKILSPFMRAVFPNNWDDEHHFADTEQQLKVFFEKNHEQGLNKNTLFFIHGSKGIGKHALVYHFCNHYNQTVILVDCKKLLPGVNPDIQIAQLSREALLHRGTLVFEHFDTFTEHMDDLYVSRFVSSLINEIQTFAKVSFALSATPWHPQSEYSDISIIEVPLKIPSMMERQAFWKSAASAYPLSEDVDLEEIANTFKLTPKQIDKSLRDAHNSMLWHEKTFIDQKLLHQANYYQLAHTLSNNAQRLVSPYNWHDLILPKDQSEQLLEACNQLKYKHIVFSKWGFENKITYGTGLGMLFTGPPGTGKTLAAQVIANTLNLEIYRVDLSQVMSKYIGETEKNLKAIFDEAALSNAVLLFDEGDALFSKRTEVGDARDKYANVETSYLLQKIEAYEGISIVTTNLLGNIDEAFIRRFAFVIHFPFPTAEYRRKIWRNVFPTDTPLSKTIDFEYLGNRFELSGGNIKNIALNAAFLAASHEREVTMKDILRSVSNEISKTGKSVLPSDFGEYAYLLDMEAGF